MKRKYLLAVFYLCTFFSLRSQSQEYAQTAITVAGGFGPGSTANQLAEPVSVVVDAAGNVFVADVTNNRIQKWPRNASVGITVAGGNGKGSAPNQLDFPYAVQLDAAGNLYIADWVNQRIQKWAPGATTGVTVAGGNGLGSGANQFNNPTGLFVDAQANIYVADYMNHRIQKWAPGAVTGITVAGGNGPGDAPGQLFNSIGVFVDNTGNIFIADQANHRIQKWAPGASKGITVAGGNGLGKAANQLDSPIGVSVDAAGNIFIADFYNNRIQKWQPGAASGTTVGTQLSYPTGIWLDAKSNLYVADRSNYRVQLFKVTRTCPPDMLITAASCSGNTTITWNEPADIFPDTIRIPLYLDANRGILTFMNSLNGHGYYKSDNLYTWRVAKEIADFIGDTGVDGHLVTITSKAESDFLYNQTNGSGLTPWIGLYSTGKPGSFRWVTDEPFSFSKWAAGEPNNYLGGPAIVAEPYVHMYDVGIWNDQRSIALRFMTEFEKPLLEYRQTAGPARGSQQSPGVYTICYERTNRITGQKDTCCFTVTIQCPAAVVPQTAVPGSTGTTGTDAGQGTKKQP